MPRRLRPAYVVEDKNGNKTFFRTKKEICETYGFTLAKVNHAIIGYPLCADGFHSIWIRFYSCKKDCDKYMLESCNCYKKGVKK